MYVCVCVWERGGCVYRTLVCWWLVLMCVCVCVCAGAGVYECTCVCVYACMCVRVYVCVSGPRGLYAAGF